MNKKNIIVISCSIVGVLVLLILIVWLLSVFKKSYTTYEKVESKMIAATEDYYKTYPELLPTEDGRYSLQYSALVDAKLIKPLNELLKNGNICNAEVHVYKSGMIYDYVPKLDCGNYYKTLELFQKIINDNNVTSTGSGLYQNEDGSYYFRGKITNNYVKFGTTGSGRKEKPIIWRILSIDSNGNIQIKSEENFTDRSVFDNRFNVIESKNSGYNDFNGSILRDFLVQMSSEENFLTDAEKQKLTLQQLCIGKRKTTDTINDGSIECAEKSEPMYFGTLTPYEYIRASLDTNCNKTGDRSCGNFNYLYNSIETTSEWTVTSTSDNTYQAYSLSGPVFELTRTSTKRKIYPTAYISAKNLYKSGTGRKDDPYVLGEEKNAD